MTVQTPLPPPPSRSGTRVAGGATTAATPPQPRRAHPVAGLRRVLFVGALTWGAYEVVSILSHEERTEINTYPSAGLATVDIGNDGGREWSSPRTATRWSCGRRSAKGCGRPASAEVVGDVLELRASCPNFGSDWCGVSYELQVPRDLALVVRADSGSVDVTGMTGVVDVDADNGSIELTGLRGTIRASTDNGRVEGFDLRSQSVTVDSDNGSVTLEFTEAPTTVTATTDNGSVEVVVPDDGEAYRVDVQSDNGSETDDVLEDPASPGRSRSAPTTAALPLALRPVRSVCVLHRPGVGAGNRDGDRPIHGIVLDVVVDVLGLGPLGDDGEHAGGGEAIDGSHLEQRSGFHLEAQHAEVGVLVDHPTRAPQQTRVGRGVGALLALEERVGRRDDADVSLDAELVGGAGEGDRQEWIRDSGELRRSDVIGRSWLVRAPARSRSFRPVPRRGSTLTCRCG